MVTHFVLTEFCVSVTTQLFTTQTFFFTFLTPGWLPYSSPLYSTRVGDDDWRAGLWSDLCEYDG